MTQQFHSGDEVEVLQMRADRHLTISERGLHWRKAKIVSIDHHGDGYAQVQFPDGTRAVFAAEHIRTDDKIPTKAHLKLGREIGAPMMTAQFSEGQEVEVWCFPDGEWEKAKIVALPHAPNALDDGRKYTVQFPEANGKYDVDGSRGLFDAAHIRLSKEQVEQELIESGERFLDAMGDEVKP